VAIVGFEQMVKLATEKGYSEEWAKMAVSAAEAENAGLPRPQ
jgi:hypothetical protein